MKTLRDRLRWSQREMAEHLGISQPTVARIELGRHAESGPISRLLDQLAAQTAANKSPTAA